VVRALRLDRAGDEEEEEGRTKAWTPSTAKTVRERDSHVRRCWGCRVGLLPPCPARTTMLADWRRTLWLCGWNGACG